MAGCNVMVFDHEHAAENQAIWNEYGSELAADFGTVPCSQPVVRDGKCEKHKVERRKNFDGDRRRWQSTDSKPSCGNGLCRAELVDNAVRTRHNTLCPDYGPGWA